MNIKSIPIDEMKTTPRPIASGPAMLRNLSLGAHTAKVDKPVSKETISKSYSDLGAITLVGIGPQSSQRHGNLHVLREHTGHGYDLKLPTSSDLSTSSSVLPD